MEDKNETPAQVADRVMKEAEARIAARAAENEALKKQLDERDAAFGPLKDENAKLKATIAATAVAAERDKLIAANPDIPAELIAGDTAEALAASVATARTVADRIHKQIAETTRIPAGGATPPPAIDPFSLPPDERIRYGLENADKIVRTNVLAYEKGEKQSGKEKEK